MLSGFSGCLSSPDDDYDEQFESLHIGFADSEQPTIRFGEQLIFEVEIESDNSLQIENLQLNWTMSATESTTGEINTIRILSNSSSIVFQPNDIGIWKISAIAEINSSTISNRISKEISVLPNDFLVNINSACKADEETSAWKTVFLSSEFEIEMRLDWNVTSRFPWDPYSKGEFVIEFDNGTKIHESEVEVGSGSTVISNEEIKAIQNSQTSSNVESIVHYIIEGGNDWNQIDKCEFIVSVYYNSD